MFSIATSQKTQYVIKFILIWINAWGFFQVGRRNREKELEGRGGERVEEGCIAHTHTSAHAHTHTHTHTHILARAHTQVT